MYRGRSFREKILENLERSFSGLLSAQTVNAISGVSSDLSSEASSFWGYELPLSSSQAKCDFLFCVHRPDQFPINNDIDWVKPFESVLDWWRNQSDPASQGINNIWFEFDQKDLISTPQSSFFFGPDKNLSTMALVDLTVQVLEMVQPNIFSSALLQKLFRLHRDLPQNVWISQIGLMLPRNVRGLRIFTQRIQWGDAKNLLRSHEYPGDLDLVLRFWSLMEVHKARVEMNIDLLPELGGTVGLEAYFDAMENALAFLLAMEPHIRSEKKDALIAFMSNLQFDETHDSQAFFSHFKVSINASLETKFKAYFGKADNDVARKIIRTKPLEKPMSC